MELLKRLQPEIVGVCIYKTDIERFAEKYITDMTEVEVKAEVAIKEINGRVDLIVSIIKEDLTEEEESRLLEIQIDPLDPIFTGGIIERELMNEIDGSRFIPLIGVDEELGEYILVEVPFDSYMEEMGYEKQE
ncbi:hypothetical protein V7124_21605 [Neobacillus niacini]|uniref:hypothetical protein n=1 Tax=Neobacillus niacini TaxID=86668 RepID=UPI002FFF1520